MDVKKHITALGFIPKGIENALHVKALAPDYTIEGMNDIVAYYLSGMLGIALIFGIFYLYNSNKLDISL